ncbi:NHL repeat containing protein [Nitrospina gracilis 3/211]|uniref:NHL repeat containing protein n=1 Tax=Nitrospina gracilis (strain 3/211) TaxID=1266370 RepID=M1ZC31_NITG3|nr:MULTISPECIES: thioredoxin-like domain-containing protein [Nitrospina]MCF8723730.1 thiol-disulfide isomerase/thioredoxin [Nitrospina sp. Nb-3]CCQ90828.1 NHL repeat containing protein [Nitrospina gracilis 3/211]
MNERLIHAPPLEAGDLPWFNAARPLDLPELKGKVVILDFWTFCCINCIHVIPTLKRIEEKFAEHVVVIGVHSPKFPGEKVTDNVERAIRRYEIVHPIVHDRDFKIWNRYAIRAWPTLVFIGPDGYILGQLPGEPNADLLEETMNSLVKELREKGFLQGNAADLIQPLKPETKSELSFPGKIAYSESDKLFAVADANHNQVVIADREGTIRHRIGSGAVGKADGGFEEASFYRPQGLCFQDDVVWVADTENHLLRKIDLNSKQVTTVAGTGDQGGFLRDTHPAKETALSSPWDVSLHEGALYFANAGTHQIGRYHIAADTVEQFAGTGAEALQDGPRLQAPFAQPSGLTVGDGKLFLADSETSAIRSIELGGQGKVETYVGTGLFDFGDRDGVGKEAVLQHPLGVHYVEGAVFIADSYNHKIRVLDLATHEVHTVEASVDIVCDDKRCTRLWEPAGVLCLDKVLYVSDTNNHRILKIDLDTEKTEIFIG